MLVDSHCHLDRLDLQEYDGNLANALQYAHSQGVERFLCIATDQGNVAAVKAIADAHQSVHCSVGVHPLSDDLGCEHTLDYLLAESKHEKVVAIGETGLDNFYAPEKADEQVLSFEVHIEAANQTGLPLVIHTREAKQKTLEMIKEVKNHRAGVLHCFTEDWDMAKQAIDMGFYVSISGIVTFKQAANVREMAINIPLDRLLVETDSPYLAPVPYRGKPCQPAYTRKTAEFLAQLRGESFEALAEATTRNYHELFAIPRT